VTRWEHIVWDWNGTLLADTDICVEVLNELMEERGLRGITLQRYRETFDFPVLDFYRSLGFPADRADFEATSHDFIARYHARAVDCPLHAGAKELLFRLADASHSQSILSAAQQSALEKAIGDYGLDHCFSHLVGARDIFAHGKEEAGVAWLKAHRFNPRSVVLVGDTLHDHTVARAMGVDCVLVAHGHHSKERLREADVPVLEGFGELGRWLTE